MRNLFLTMAAVATIFLAVACTKQETAESPRFDPRYVAAEAYKGNLGPLTELNSACSAEVERNGRRMSACTAQDEVRKLSKPITIRF